MPDHLTISPTSPTTSPAAIKDIMSVQQQLQNEIEIQPLQKTSIQFKLAIGASDDSLEHEADAMADRVMRMPEQNFIQRKCSDCEVEEKLQRKTLVSFIQGKESSAGTLASDAISNQINASKGNGSGMDSNTQSFMQSRFGADFSEIKIHTGGESIQMNRDLNAKAFTVGNDIYFNEGQYNPVSAEGKHLLAHELTHTVQQGVVDKIQKQPIDEPVLTDRARIDELKIIVEGRLQETITLKATLEPASDPENDAIRDQIKANREEMILLLEERIRLVSDLLALQTECNAETAFLEEEFLITAQWLFPLKRWQKRIEIESINERIAEINAQIDQFMECNDETEKLYGEIDQLTKRKKSLVKELTTTAIEYKQFDKRWGSATYGNDAACSTVKEAACGPSALAMVLNFYELENPEGSAKDGVTEIILPSETATYAKDHGRVCNQGTNGDEMMKGVAGKWEDYRGRAIKLTEVFEELENGRLVIFLCKNCKGKNAKGQIKTYGGHYMVLSGVNDSRDIFNVLDSGRKEENNIETIDLNNLKTTVTGFWTVETAE